MGPMRNFDSAESTCWMKRAVTAFSFSSHLPQIICLKLSKGRDSLATAVCRPPTAVIVTRDLPLTSILPICAYHNYWLN